MYNNLQKKARNLSEDHFFSRKFKFFSKLCSVDAWNSKPRVTESLAFNEKSFGIEVSFLLQFLGSGNFLI